MGGCSSSRCAKSQHVSLPERVPLVDRSKRRCPGNLASESEASARPVGDLLFAATPRAEETSPTSVVPVLESVLTSNGSVPSITTVALVTVATEVSDSYAAALEAARSEYEAPSRTVSTASFLSYFDGVDSEASSRDDRTVVSEEASSWCSMSSEACLLSATPASNFSGGVSESPLMSFEQPQFSLAAEVEKAQTSPVSELAACTPASTEAEKAQTSPVSELAACTPASTEVEKAQTSPVSELAACTPASTEGAVLAVRTADGTASPDAAAGPVDGQKSLWASGIAQDDPKMVEKVADSESMLNPTLQSDDVQSRKTSFSAVAEPMKTNISRSIRALAPHRRLSETCCMTPMIKFMWG